MRHFESIDKVRIDGRGTMYGVDEKWTGTGDEWTPEVMRGETVCINGVLVEVKGVEVWRMHASRENPYHSTYGIIV